MPKMRILPVVSLLLMMTMSAVSQAKDVEGPMVQMFEWQWSDIAQECEDFLGPKGYKSIQVSPPAEHSTLSDIWWTGYFSSWKERYQPVSYDIEGRGGDTAAFVDMVTRCKAEGIDIIVDAVINHLIGWPVEPNTSSAVVTGYNNSEIEVWSPSTNFGIQFRDSAGQVTSSMYDVSDYRADSCGSAGINYNDGWQVQNCWLVGLMDLDTSQSDVQDTVAGFLNSLISMGVAGFRFDATKHVHPNELKAILDKVQDLNVSLHPAGGRPIFIMEVIDLNGSEPVKASNYTTEDCSNAGYEWVGSQNVLRCSRDLGPLTEFKYGNHMQEKFRNRNNGKIADFAYLVHGPNAAQASDPLWGMVSSDKAVVFLDNHDNQRGQGSGGFYTDAFGTHASVLTSYDGQAQYEIASAFMLAWPFGTPRIMSGYEWDQNFQNQNGTLVDVNEWYGPPQTSYIENGRSRGNIIGTFDAQGNSRCFDDLSNFTGRHSQTGTKWACEHRILSIANMVEFHNVTKHTTDVSNWWDNGTNQIAFSRGTDGFIVINNQPETALGPNGNGTFTTGLAAGDYCNVMVSSLSSDETQCLDENGAVVSPVTVAANGQITQSVAGMSGLALHTGAIVVSNPDVDGDGIATVDEIFYGLDPNDPADALQDLDSDGLTNIDEINVHNTDPTDMDSDDDTFNDGQEISAGTDPNDPTDPAVPQAPVADAGADVTVVVGDTAQFNASGSVDTDGTIVSYAWNSTETGALTGLAPTYQFNNVGTFTITLTVTDNDGLTSTDDIVVTVQTFSCSPTFSTMNMRGSFNSWGSLAMTQNAACEWEAMATFTSAATERFKFDVAADWVTNYGDDNADGVANIVGDDIYITQGAGDYLVTFNDTTLAYSVVKQQGAPQAPTADAGADQSVASGTTVTFDGTGSADTDGTIASYAWSSSAFSGNLTGASPSFTFNTDGSYTVTLTVTDNDGLTATDSMVVTVTTSSCSFNFATLNTRGSHNGWGSTAMTQGSSCLWEATITFAASDQFKFDRFGDWSQNYGDNNADGIGDSAGNNIVIGAGAGVYNVTFNDSTFAYTVVKVSAAPQAPTANASNDQTVTVGDTVQFDGTASTDIDGTIASYSWASTAFSSALTGALPTFVFSTAGTYTVTLTVVDNDGLTSTDDVVITVEDVPSCSSAQTQMYLRGTFNSWGSTAMTLNSSCQWEATVNFASSGQFKFDVNADWSLNYGDNNADGVAQQGGGNIAAGAGSRTITFDDATLQYTVN